MTSLTSAKLCFLPYCLVILLYVSSPNSVAFPSATSTSDTEAKALLKWKASLFLNQALNNLTWYDPPTHHINATNSSSTNPKPRTSPCTWTGVSCNAAGSVNTIDLFNWGIQGTLHEFSFLSFPNLEYLDLSFNKLFDAIPPLISNLSKLHHLDLSQNQFSGRIPPEIGLLRNLTFLGLHDNTLLGNIPNEIGNLKSLVELYLEYNKLDGSIPRSLGNLTSLTYLFLYRNQLSGSIPHQEIGYLKSLVVLYLSANNLSGLIPPNIGNLIKLHTLFVSLNQLSGLIPKEIGNLKSLVDIDLAFNNLSGLIPPNIGNLINLQTLYLHYNQLYGLIPNEIGNLKSLVRLSLSKNKLNGSIPASFANLSNLETLVLFNNQLSGSIPQELVNLKNLTKLSLDTNQFSGYLPSNICQGGKLTNFSVFRNYLTGPIPKSLKNCTSLFRLRLDQNQLTGNISEDFGVYPNLYFIDVSHNNLYGEISHNWKKCPKLTALRLAGSNLTGSIPPEIGTATQIRVLDLSSNHLVGFIPMGFGRLTFLERLMLNGNQLSSRIPSEFGSLTNLDYLDLSTNKFSDSIPSILGGLLELYHLNLSNNKLSQAIPLQLEKLVQLNELDLSHNSLECSIPSAMSNMKSLVMLNLSHNNLSGSIPSTFEDMHGLLYVDISYNHLEGSLPNNRAFREAHPETLKRNKGLCGKVGGLPTCDQHGSKKDHKLIFSLLAVFVLLDPSFHGTVFQGGDRAAEKKKRNSGLNEGGEGHEDLGSPHMNEGPLHDYVSPHIEPAAMETKSPGDGAEPSAALVIEEAEMVTSVPHLELHEAAEHAQVEKLPTPEDVAGCDEICKRLMFLLEDWKISDSMASGGPINPPSIPKVSMAGDGEGSASVETKEEKGKGCRKKRLSHTLCSPFTDPLRKKRTMSVSDATETPPCFDPSKPLPIEDVKAVMDFCIGWKNDIIAEVQLESCSVGADFFYKLIDDTEWISSRHLDMATFLIRKRQLAHPLVFGTQWTTADCCLQQFLESVKATGKTRGAKKAAASNISDLTPSKLNNIHHYVRGTWQHGYGQAWTKVRKVYFPYNLKGSHWVAIELDFVNHTATVYDSYSDFTATKKLVGLLRPISETLAQVLYNMHFYEASELEEVKQRGLQMSSFTAFSVCTIGDVPQQRDGASCGIMTVKFLEHLSAGISLHTIDPLKSKYYRLKLAIEGLRGEAYV